jgi:hypothetical protein
MVKPIAAIVPVALLLAGLTNASAQNASGPDCGEFTVYIENDDVEFFDIDPEGTSAGDRRVGRYDVLDENSDHIGYFLFASTILPPLGDGTHQALGNGRYDLANGTIAASMVYELVDPTDTQSGAVQEFVYPVLGGTGEFAGVHGTLLSMTDEAGRRAQRFDLYCGD